MIKTYRNIKLIVLCIIFFCASLYAIEAYRDILVNNDYSRNLIAKSLKLQESKVYLFTATNIISNNKDTIVIPIENKSFPDSLCYLFYDNEWKLRLSNKLRNSDKETISNPLFPWCCTQQPHPTFFDKGSTVDEKFLTKDGIKFNYYSGNPVDRFALKLYKENGKSFLVGKLFFLENSYPINAKKDNLYELNFCNYTDTINDKYVFSFPFCGGGNKPERLLLNIQNDNVSYTNQLTNQITKINQPVFEINNIQFQIKDNYKPYVSYALLALYTFILLVSVYNIFRLFQLYRKLPHRNLIVSEQSYILTLRLLFNCIILLGFPLLLIQLKVSPSRLNTYATLVVILNINWFWLYSAINTKSGNRLSSLKLRISQTTIATIILIFIAVVIASIRMFSNYEKLFDIPVLHITKLLYVLLPFTLSSGLIKAIEKNKYIQKSKINIAYILIIFLSLIIAWFSKDFATPLFTFLALFLITILQKENLTFILRFIKQYKYSLSILLLLFASFVYLNREDIFSWFNSKVYRFSSTLYLPNDQLFNIVDEQSKQTVAQQLYLLKSSFETFDVIPNFNQAILPAWKSTFFSDYAVLWSFKIGNYPFLILYFSILLYISYCIISLLVVLNKKIALHNGKMVFYDKKVVLIFNILLSLFLVQYIYTFLSNLWLLPLTGQSPGVLCPSFFELGFHILFINSLYIFINRKQVIPLPDKRPILYTKIKRKSSLVLIGLFVISLFFLGLQISRIVSLDNKMRWDIANQLSSQYQKPKSDSLEFFAREAFENEERAKFKMLHQQYYNDENLASPNFAVTTSYINCNTNIDSINCIKKTAFETKDNDLYAYTKNVNTIPVEAISNPFYSGCPLKAKSINYDIQKVANTALQNWAVKINADKANNHEMVSGCIIIAKNDGQILVSSSYPFLFNENKYHLKYVENNINERFDFKFKYYTVKDYINFSEYDQMPGSIVKPLLAYCGLKVLPSSNKNISSKNLNYFIGYSDPTIAFTLFKQLANINAIDTVKQLYKNDFSIMQFYDLNSDNVLTKDDKTLKSYAIGQQNKLTFKDIVQSYTRIKTGKKVLYTYDIPDTSRHFESISLADEKLKLLQTAMKYPLRNGTAANVGKEFKNMKINYSNYLAKTGTAQIADDPNHNKTSSFIIVTDKYTIGIQLFGDLPKNENLGGCSARHLFINLIKTLTDYGILQRVHK